MTTRIRKMLAGLVLGMIALLAGGCHDGYSTYGLGVSADYRWDDRYGDCRPAYRPAYCPPPRHRQHRHW